MAEELDRIANEAGGQARKEAELVNLTFTITAARMHTYDWQGEERKSFIATCETEEGPDDFYIGGAKSFRQLKWLVENDLLPVQVKMVRDVSKEGSPYILKAIDGVKKPRRSADKDVMAAAVEAVGVDAVLEAATADGLETAFQFSPQGELTLTNDAGVAMQAKALALVKKLAEA